MVMKAAVTILATVIATQACLAKAGNVEEYLCIPSPSLPDASFDLENAFSIKVGERTPAIPERGTTQPAFGVYLAGPAPYMSIAFSPLVVGDRLRAGVDISTAINGFSRWEIADDRQKNRNLVVLGEKTVSAIFRHHLGQVDLYEKIGFAQMKTYWFDPSAHHQTGVEDKRWIPSACLGVSYTVTDHLALFAECSALFARLPYGTPDKVRAYPASLVAGMQLTF